MAAALGRAAVVVLGLTITASALAAQAMLPLQLQELASRVAGSVGFDIPSDPVAGTSFHCGDDMSDRREGPEGDCAPSTKQSAVPVDPSARPDDAPGSGDGSEDDLDAPEENEDGVFPEGEDAEEPVERGDLSDEDQAADEDDEDDGDNEADEDDGEDEEDGPEQDDDGDEEDGREDD